MTKAASSKCRAQGTGCINYRPEQIKISENNPNPNPIPNKL